jgi:hypothetical protein
MRKILLFLPVLLMISCSVQKRRYQHGYHVTWHHKQQEAGKTSTRQAGTSEKPAYHPPILTEQEEPVSASAGSGLSFITTPGQARPVLLTHRNPEDSCDILIFKDGAEIKGKVQEIGIHDIRYKRCDALEGPIYISRKTELFMIKYANGTREVIKSEAPAPEQIQHTRPTREGYGPQKKFRKITHPAAIGALIAGIASIALAYIALVAIILGALPVSFFMAPLLASLAAVILGKTAMSKIKEAPEVYKGKGMAIPGFVMGAVILGIFITVGLITLLALL